MSYLVSKLYRWSGISGLILCVGITCMVLDLESQAAPAPGSPRGWTRVELDGSQDVQMGKRPYEVRGAKFRMERATIQSALGRARKEQGNDRIREGADLWLPMPDGELRGFVIVESPVMAPELAARFPGIKTYRGVGRDHLGDAVRVDLGPQGLHAQVLSPDGNAYVDPVNAEGTEYVAYYTATAQRSEEEFDCLTETSSVTSTVASTSNGIQSDGRLRIYRLAVAATGEYTQFHGGTVQGGLSAIATAVNRLNGVYELELSIRFLLVANNDRIIFTNAPTDGYSNADGVAMLSQNQSKLDAVIGSANYDVGHVFSTGGGGIAQMNSVGVSGWKARGVTGRASPVGDSFYIDYFAHEMGHQFGAHHTFNGVTGSCSANNRHPGTAYELGSGSTIMSYSGICGSDNLQYSSDPYFHSASLVEIKNFIATSGATPAGISNLPPVVYAGEDRVIPRGTPFELTASGSDPEGDALTYCWEELDLGGASALLGQDAGSGPLFRSFPPVTDVTRSFPQLSRLLSNQSSPVEVLPTTSRTLNFRVTGRDNHAGGGAFAMDSLQVTVAGGAGPFVVSAPNASTTLSGTQLVTWAVAGTDLAPVSAGAVDILLSTNGGYDFPILLASSTPNDGVEPVILPDIRCETARIKVRASGSIFFDVSDVNFSIVPQGAAPVDYVVEAHSFTNLATVLVPAFGTKGNASQFPMTLDVDGLEGTVDTVTVQLHGLTHPCVEDLDVLLVGPDGQSVLLMSDCSGGAMAHELELSFSDQGLAFPHDGSLGSGNYQPANVGLTGDAFPVAGPYGATLSKFQGVNPNGAWSLYLVDDAIGDAGFLAGGWSLSLRTRRSVTPSNEPPMIVGQSVRYVHVGSTLTVTNEAIDPDGSGPLTYALRPDAPPGVRIDSDGVLTWSPNTALVGTTNLCIVRVTDSGLPALTAESTLAVVVVEDPAIQFLQLTDGLARVRWSSVPECHYQLECTEDLAAGNWNEIGEAVGADDFTMETTCPAGSGGQRFFRVRVAP